MAPPMWCGLTTIRPSSSRWKTISRAIHTVAMENFKLADDEIIDGGQGALIVQPTRQ